MARWIHLVHTNCREQAREAEFNDWYSNTHLADMLRCPGVVSARRYRREDVGEGEAKYLAIYEIEAEDIERAMRAYFAYVQSLRERGRISGLVEIVSRATFKEI